MENWITRAEIHGNRALFDAGVEWATRRAKHPAATEESSAAQPAPADPDTPQSLHDVALVYVDSLGRSFGILPAILDTIRRAIREPMAVPGGRVAINGDLVAAYNLAYEQVEEVYTGRSHTLALRAVYDLGRQHGAACPYIRSSDEGTSYCALAEQQAPAEPAPLPPIRVGQTWRRVDGVVVKIKEYWRSCVYPVLSVQVNDPYGVCTFTQCGKYLNDDIPLGENDMDLAELIEDAPIPAPAPPAPCGGLTGAEWLEHEATR
jgi:hypothetical protein